MVTKHVPVHVIIVRLLDSMAREWLQMSDGDYCVSLAAQYTLKWIWNMHQPVHDRGPYMNYAPTHSRQRSIYELCTYLFTAEVRIWIMHLPVHGTGPYMNYAPTRSRQRSIYELCTYPFTAEVRIWNIHLPVHGRGPYMKYTPTRSRQRSVYEIYTYPFTTELYTWACSSDKYIDTVAYVLIRALRHGRKYICRGAA